MSGTPAAELTELTAETQYYARVKTLCEEDNESEWSNVCTFFPTYYVVIGTGTGTNSYLPTNSANKYSLTQQIYTAEELGQAGNIVNIEFLKGNNVTCSRNLDIYMVSTDKSGFTGSKDWITVTEADKVFSGTVSFTDDDWTVITLDRPFGYDGESNVAIMVDDNTGSAGSAASFQSFPAQSQAIRVYSRTTNYRATTPGSYNGTVESVKNHLRILKTDPAPICYAPTGLAVSEFDHQSATVNWNGDAESWVVAYRAANAEQFIENEVNTTEYTLTGLAAETGYTVKVAAKCGEETVWGGEVRFTTLSAPCSSIELDENGIYRETFESYTTESATETGVQPDCWDVFPEEGVSLTEATMPQLYRGFATSGDYTLRLKNRCVYAMPALDEDIDLGALTMTFRLRQTSSVYRLQVGMLNEEGGFDEVKTINIASTEMEQVTVDFSEYSGSGRRIAFRNTVKSGSTLAYSTNYIDDIVLSYSDVCAMRLPYTEKFEGYTAVTAEETGVQPGCWEVIPEEGVSLTSATMPQLYRGFATSGNYSLRLKNRCVYAMPALSSEYDIHGLTMTFNLRQAKSVYRLQVGVLDEDGEFEMVKTFNLPESDPVQEVSVDFSEYSGNGNRIAFRNTVKSGSTLAYSTNYIDDIHIDTTGAKMAASSVNVLDADGMEAYLENIAVYPNPTTGMLQIEAVDVQRVECYSQTGQLMGVYESVNELNLGEFADGVYMLRITVPQGVTMRKVVKR